MNAPAKALAAEAASFAGIMTLATVGWFIARQLQRHLAASQEAQK